MSIPYIKEDEHGISTLYVHDRPFFCRSGEIHNSGASDRAYMRTRVWPALSGLHMNSVIAPVYWEQIEEKEGCYDFASVDELIDDAREAGLHLILLWFGLWKNAESMYVPAWMKRNTETYFRAEKASGEKMTTISPLCTAAVEKDAAAYAALMRHIGATDGEENTVIVMQVENEIGLLGTDRDYSPAADAAYYAPVPEEILRLAPVLCQGPEKQGEGTTAAVAEDAAVRSGTWEQLFGENAGEIFMAWHFANAVERIASSGKAEYPLPCYVNAWLRQYPWYPGSYPSGGPVEWVHPVWKAAAPSLFALGPDIYVPGVADVMDSYANPGNPLFIPETRKDAVAASYALYAFAGKHAICFSPFGIEDLFLDPSEIDRPPMEVMAALNIDPSAFDTAGSKECLARSYDLIDRLDPLYRKYRGTDHMKAFARHGELDYGTFLRFADFDIAVSYAPRRSGKPVGAGIVIELGEGRFLLTGVACDMTFRAKSGRNRQVDILRLEEGILEDGKWKRSRVLNGDEKMSLRFSDMPQMLYAEAYGF